MIIFAIITAYEDLATGCYESEHSIMNTSYISNSFVSCCFYLASFSVALTTKNSLYNTFSFKAIEAAGPYKTNSTVLIIVVNV